MRGQSTQDIMKQITKINSPSVSLPLADNYFGIVQLQNAQVQKYLNLADKYVKTTLHQRKLYKAFTQGQTLFEEPYEVFKSDWTKVSSENNVDFYHQKLQPGKTSRRMQVIGQIDGNFKDLMSKFQSSTRGDGLATEKMLFPSVQDSIVLQKRLPKTTTTLQNPTSTSIKWAVYKPNPLSYQLDSCYIEYCGFSHASNGEPFGYRVTLPTRIPECPEFFNNGQKIVRISSHSVMLFFPKKQSKWEDVENTKSTEFFHIIQTNFRKEKPAIKGIDLFENYLEGLVIKQDIPAGVSTSPSTQSSNLINVGISPQVQRTILLKQENECRVCSRPFPLLRSRHECVKCNKLVCKKCIIFPSKESTAAVNDKTCMRCFQTQNYKEYEVPAIALIESPLQNAGNDENAFYDSGFILDFRQPSPPTVPSTSATTKSGKYTSVPTRNEKKLEYELELEDKFNYQTIIASNSANRIVSPRNISDFQNSLGHDNTSGVTDWEIITISKPTPARSQSMEVKARSPNKYIQQSQTFRRVPSVDEVNYGVMQQKNVLREMQRQFAYRNTPKFACR